MKINLLSLDIQTLKTLHEKEDAMLKVALLEGRSWEEMIEQRLKVTELAIALQKKRFPSNIINPAEFVKRENYDDLVP